MGVRRGSRTYMTGAGNGGGSAVEVKQTASGEAIEQLAADDYLSRIAEDCGIPYRKHFDAFINRVASEFGGVPYDESGSWSRMVGPEEATTPDDIETAAPWYQEVQFGPALSEEQALALDALAEEQGIDVEWPHEDYDQVYLEDIAAREAEGGWDGWRQREWERFHPATVGLLDARERFLEHHDLIDLLEEPAFRFWDEKGSFMDEPELYIRDYFEANGPLIAKELEADFIAEQVAAGVGAEDALAGALAVDFSELVAASWDEFQEAVERAEQG